MISCEKLVEEQTASDIAFEYAVTAYNHEKQKFMAIYPDRKIEDMHNEDANINFLYMKLNEARVKVATATVASCKYKVDSSLLGCKIARSTVSSSPEEIKKILLADVVYKIEFARLKYAEAYEYFALFAFDKTFENRAYYESNDNLSESELECKKELYKVDSAYTDLILIEI